MQQRRRRPGYQYWFPARTYGWGSPRTWQGWLVFDAYLGLMIVFLFIALFGGGSSIYGIFCMVLATAGLAWICYKKGEPRKRR